MKLADLIRALSGIVCETVCQDDPEITTVTNNTAKVVPGALFCAIKGAKFDGHEYLTQAVDAGAAALVISRDWQGTTPEGIAVIRVSDSYLALWDAIPPHKPMILRTFLGKIARRTALKQWEKSRTQKRGGGEVALALEELSEYLTDGYTPETAIEMAELTQILNEFLRKLPKEERQVFVCRYWYLDPIADIAKRFGYTQSKVKSMLARTRMKLRATLTKEGITL